MSNYTFDRAFEELDTANVDVDQHHNGTGYLNTLTKVKVGTDCQKFTDRDGRRGVILPVVDGLNVVVFERSPGEDTPILACNTPRSETLPGLASLLGLNGSLSDDTFAQLLGYNYTEKKGERQSDLAKFVQAVAKAYG